MGLSSRYSRLLGEQGHHIALLGILVLLGAFCAPALAQESNPRRQIPRDQTTVRLGVDEVILDIVVRDKKGRPVTDLKPQEIQVFEEGVKQNLTAFRLAEAGVVTLPGEPAGATQPNPLRNINLVTLVFDQLNVDGRKLSAEAAKAFLHSQLRENTYCAVFMIDRRLYVLQQFTNDRAKLEQAIDRATSGNYTEFASHSDAIRRQLETATSSQASAETAAAAAGPGGAPAGIGAAFADAKFAEVTLNTLRFSALLQREQQGQSSLYALLSLIKGQRRLAGRKTVIYFSEGLQVPPNRVELFRSTLSDANRANVSFYAVDARGLIASSLGASSRDALNRAASASRSQITSRGGRAVTPEEALAMDTAEESIRLNTQETLSQLAVSTGGFLIANTNDLRPMMDRVARDIACYYEVAYAPQLTGYDGKFRRISVKVSRSGLTVQTRNGYFALPPTEGAPLMPYEMPLLTALSSGAPPRVFEYRAAALHFDRNSEGVQHKLVIEVPLSNFTFTTDKDKKVYRTRFSILALLKDASGNVVHKFSQDYPVEGPLENLDAIKRGNVIFMRTFRAAAGRYTLESAAMDNATGKVSARKSLLIVGAARPAVELSSLTLIKRVDQAPGDNQEEDPLRFEGARIVPSISESIQVVPGLTLSFYFIIYPAAAAGSGPTLELQFLQDRKVVSRSAPQLPSPDKDGRIPYIATVEAASFQSGRYEVRVIVRQGQTAAEEHAFFTLVTN
jgi:VWFA-related protein